MKNKINFKFSIFFLIGIFLIGCVLAEVSHCCEKTVVASDGSGGAWCVDSSGYKGTTAECDATNANCQ